MAGRGRSDIPSPVPVPEKGGGCLRHLDWNNVDLIFNYSGAADNDLDVSCPTRQDSTARVLAQSVDTRLLEGVIRDRGESEGACRWLAGSGSKIPSCD